jgi:hypothetical protein
MPPILRRKPRSKIALLAERLPPARWLIAGAGVATAAVGGLFAKRHTRSGTTTVSHGGPVPSWTPPREEPKNATAKAKPVEHASSALPGADGSGDST